ncbi:peroxisome assembly protein 12 [Epargyreus clarus]|uniref:peroxisome assembly protein 12 n=1 Tax=Epargyreus clarus TaxID=520877 RepID=UPI003C2F09EC
MAVYAAHLTRTLHGTPSVFQITAQEALGSTVKPALRRLIEYVATVYPNKCGWCERWYDELYLLFDCCMQYHYLKHYAGSFSECFYGLLRVPIVQSNEFSSGPRLPDLLEKGSLAFLVLVPYVRDKLEKVVERWREDHEDGRLGKNISDRARKAALRVYSIMHFVIESWKLLTLARYLVGRSRSPTLGLHLLGLTLKDAPPPEPEENTWSDLAKSVVRGKFSEAIVTFPMVWGAVAACAEYGAFAVQFLRWWDARAPLATAALPIPPALERDERATRYLNKCPLCLQPWKVPTVLPVSGYVFCYGCISRHLRSAAACPVTRLPAVETSLVRLYLDV